MNSGSKKHRSEHKHSPKDKKHGHNHHHHHHHHHEDKRKEDLTLKSESLRGSEFSARVSAKLIVSPLVAHIDPRAPPMKVDLHSGVNHRQDSPTSPESRSGLSAASTPVLAAAPNPAHPAAATVGSPSPRGAVVGRWLLDGGCANPPPFIGPRLPKPAAAPLIGPRLP
jgi:hypothetical protein